MKKTTFKSICLVWLSCLLLDNAPVHAEIPFQLEQNDVVVFLGGANMVYLQKAGFLESILTDQFAASSPTFRDLAWEADTVSNKERSSNDGASEHISMRMEVLGI